MSTVDRTSAPALEGLTGARAAVVRRGLLVGSCLIGLVAAANSGVPSERILADADLALVLRTMAAIKGLIAVAAFAGVWWRVGADIPVGRFAAYLAGIGLIVVGSVMIWRLSALVGAAAAVHVGLLLLILTAILDDRSSRQASE